MLTNLHIRNFKSWADTGNIRCAPITGFFGANSSGKTSLLQFLLMLKQTVESSDRSRVLHLGDGKTLVDLGTVTDILHGRQTAGEVAFDFQLRLPEVMAVNGHKSTALVFESAISLGSPDGPIVQNFHYELNGLHLGLTYASPGDYKLNVSGYKPKRQRGRPPLAAPVRFYGFPDELYASYSNLGFASEFALALEESFRNTFYLGPLREYPQPSYTWSGETTQDVGRRGELAIPALLASRSRGPTISFGQGRKRRETVEERVVHWLREMNLIVDFSLHPIAEGRKEYEVLIKRTHNSPSVPITHVGFGLSQILPVLVLCYYAPEGSTLILEQPEIHLHPSVQYALADVFIEVAQLRKVQIILESHSEHLLTRLQRRIADETVENADDLALYFCETNSRSGASELKPLELDLYGNIRNWPRDFFGNQMEEASQMTMAALRRQTGQTDNGNRGNE